MMKKILAAALVLMSLLMAFGALAEEAAQTALPEGVVKEYRWFVNEYKTVRGRTVTYYKDVYAYNHGDWGLTPFDSTVPAEYFVKDEEGTFALAPIVLDITDAMREALYGISLIPILYTANFAFSLFIFSFSEEEVYNLLTKVNSSCHDIEYIFLSSL